MRWGILLVLCGCGAILESSDGEDGETDVTIDPVENAEGGVEYADTRTDRHEDIAATDVPVPLDDVCTADDYAADDATTTEATDAPCADGVWMCSGICGAGWLELVRACAPACGTCSASEPATYNAVYCNDDGSRGVPCRPPPGEE